MVHSLVGGWLHGAFCVGFIRNLYWFPVRLPVYSSEWRLTFPHILPGITALSPTNSQLQFVLLIKAILTGVRWSFREALFCISSFNWLWFSLLMDLCDPFAYKSPTVLLCQVVILQTTQVRVFPALPITQWAIVCLGASNTVQFLKGCTAHTKNSCSLIESLFFCHAAVERILNEYMAHTPEPRLYICPTWAYHATDSPVVRKQYLFHQVLYWAAATEMCYPGWGCFVILMTPCFENMTLFVPRRITNS